MLINCAEVSRLALLSSTRFNKEGLLFVREKQEGLFNQWKSETYIERLCRLKGNLLFILSTSHFPTPVSEETTVVSTPTSTSNSTPAATPNASSIIDHRIVYILVLEEFSVKLVDESANKHFGFTVDFGKNDPTKPFHFATVSHYERDSWVEAIHLASFGYLRSLYSNFLKLKETAGCLEEAEAEESSQIEPRGYDKGSLRPVVFTLSCLIGSANETIFEPNLCVAVYQRTEREKHRGWQYVANTEIVTSRSARFAKQFELSPDAVDARGFGLKFKVYDVIERVTNTRVLLGESVFPPEVPAAAPPGAGAGGEIGASLDSGRDKSSTQGIALEITSILRERDSQSVGKLTLNGKGLLGLSQRDLSGSSLNRPRSLSVKRSYSPSLGPREERENNLSTPSSTPTPNPTPSTSTSTSTSTSARFPSTEEQRKEQPLNREESSCSFGDKSVVRSPSSSTSSVINSGSHPHLVPNSLHPDNSPITSITPLTSQARIMSSPLSIFTLDGNLFVNTIHRSFQFEVPSTNGVISVNELMAESTFCLVFPQTVMNIFMDDEKKLMNCVTYSLGEVKSEWQRPQMRVLESHLRLVNVVTESLNELYQFQLQNKCFRPSTAKKELFLQFVPINFHLQRLLVTETESSNEVVRNGNGNTNGNGNSNGNGTDASHYKVLDIHSVGAFAAHNLGFESGGLLKGALDMKTPTNNNNKDISGQSIAKVWRAMRDFFRISFLTQQIDVTLKRLMRLVEEENNDNRQLIEAYQLIDSWAKTLVTILNPNEVEQSLLSLEMLRYSEEEVVTPPANGSASSTATRMERTMSLPLDEVRTRLENGNKPVRSEQVPLRRHRSLPTDELHEFEPVDLLHLNIRASLISISSKLNSKTSSSRLSRSDIEPSRKKLACAIEALHKTSRLTYAIESIRLEREQLESFYTMRLRRDMIFSQAITTLIIGVLGEINSIAFQERLVETKTLFAYFESLLSCYGDEIGMLQDMAFALNEINECVTFSFSAGREQANIPRIEGNGYNLRVIIPVPSSPVFPSKNIECSVTALLFNVGINEHATLAETFSYVKLQDEINKDSFLRLENYVTNQVNLEDRQLIDDLTALKTELYSHRAKNVRVLHLMEQITYQLDGLRFTSCKSAKDRTAMGVTLEEVRLCFRVYGLNELNESALFQQMLDTLRSEGTRRENTRKNVGVAKYAFNSLQLMTLPKVYRPPPGTYGNVQN